MDTLQLLTYTQRILNGGSLTFDEALALLTLNDDETPLLLAMADKIRHRFRGNEVDCCAIVGGRSGRCPEDCRFCAQSAHYHTGLVVHALIEIDAMVRAACKAKTAGATRFSIVTGGRSVEEGPEFERILRAVSLIRETVHIEVCCSLGFIAKTTAGFKRGGDFTLP